MPARIYTDRDANLTPLKKRRVAVIGFGSQGHAHALNLKNSGIKVTIGLYKGSKSIAVAKNTALKFFLLPRRFVLRKSSLWPCPTSRFHPSTRKISPLTFARVNASSSATALPFTIKRLNPQERGCYPRCSKRPRPHRASSISGRSRGSRPFRGTAKPLRPSPGDRHGMGTRDRCHTRRPSANHL